MSSSSVLETSVRSGATRRLTSWRLVGARVALDADTAVMATVEIRNGRIAAITPENTGALFRAFVRPSKPPLTVDLSGYLLLPGLINAHDHLEFNLFPRLGKGPYANFEDWANDVYHPDRSPVRDHLLVPKPVRLWWGAIKNLLSGVTTVCHHNAAIPRETNRLFPVRVMEHFGWSHSLAFGGDMRGAFRSTPPDSPFIVHLAEGTDQRSRDEIFRLDRLKALASKTVIVHGVGLDHEGHSLLEGKGAGLIWCPTSNVFTLGKTLSKEQTTQHRKVALGSDSALTGQGDILDEIQFARHQTDLSPKEIYSLVSHSAARVLRLKSGEGTVQVGGPADLIAVADTGDPPCEKLAQITTNDLELVIVGGEAKLLSASATGRWPRPASNTYEVLRVGNTERLVQCPIKELFDSARRHLGEEIYLAGRRVSS